MTKEEYFDSLSYLFEHAHKCTNCVHVNIGCDECEKDNTMECDIAHYRLTCLIENYYEILNHNPYKFEDLKEGMWVWDDKEKKCNKIIKIEGRNIDFYYITKDTHRYKVEFEEGRFFPIMKAYYYNQQRR